MKIQFEIRRKFITNESPVYLSQTFTQVSKLNKLFATVFPIRQRSKATGNPFKSGRISIEYSGHFDVSARVEPEVTTHVPLDGPTLCVPSFVYVCTQRGNVLRLAFVLLDIYRRGRLRLRSILAKIHSLFVQRLRRLGENKGVYSGRISRPNGVLVFVDARAVRLRRSIVAIWIDRFLLFISSTFVEDWIMARDAGNATTEGCSMINRGKWIDSFCF